MRSGRIELLCTEGEVPLKVSGDFKHMSSVIMRYSGPP